MGLTPRSHPMTKTCRRRRTICRTTPCPTRYGSSNYTILHLQQGRDNYKLDQVRSHVQWQDLVGCEYKCAVTRCTVGAGFRRGAADGRDGEGDEMREAGEGLLSGSAAGNLNAQLGAQQ